MSDSQTPRAALVDSILQEAEEAARQVVAEAEKARDARTAAVGRQVDQILKEAERTAAEKVKDVQRNSASRLEVDTRRQTLRVRDEIVKLALKKARERIARMPEQSDYRKILLGWTVEAAVGLGQPVAVVNTTAQEMTMVDEEFLTRAAQEVHRLTGREVQLLRSEEPPLLSQGVTLTAPDGHVAYSNQVETRIIRLQTEIRRLIQSRLSEEV